MISTQPCSQRGVLILAMSAGDVADKNHKFMMTHYNVEKGHGQDSRREREGEKISEYMYSLSFCWYSKESVQRNDSLISYG